MAIARLVHGPRTLDLNTTTYALGVDFVPPDINESYTISSGTSANEYGGGDYIGSQANNKSWMFSLRVLGASVYQVEAAVSALRSFLALAYDKSYPLYFQWRDGDLPEPIYGTLGAPISYEIVTASLDYDKNYYASSAQRANGVFVIITTEIKPFATLPLMRLAHGKGGLSIDEIGSLYGQERGIDIYSGATNVFSNPVFGYAPTDADFDYDWTIGAGIALDRNRNLDYCYPGQTQSACVSIIGTTNRVMYQTLTLSAITYTVQALVIKNDRSEITASDIAIYFASTVQTATIESIGNGWYRAFYTGTASASAANYGIGFYSPLIVAAAQCVQESSISSIIHGDKIGCSWSGVAHASSSVRTGAILSVSVDSHTFNRGSGAIAVVWKPNYGSAVGSDRYLFSSGANSYAGWFESTDSKFYFTDGTNTISSNATSYSANVVMRFQFVYGPSYLAIYKNGILISSGSTYTPPAAIPALIYIGYDSVGGARCLGSIMGFTIYGYRPSAAQIAAIDSASSARVSAGFGVDVPPIFWTKDGDDILDNADDSTYANWGVAMCVPGNYPADTIISGDLTNAVAIEDFWMFQHITPVFTDPAIFNVDFSGTSSATSEGGAYKAISTFGAGGILNTNGKNLYLSRSVLEFARIRGDTGTTNVEYGDDSLDTPNSVTISDSSFGIVFIREKLLAWESYARMKLAGTINLPSSQEVIYIAAPTSGTFFLDFVKSYPRPAMRLNRDGTTMTDFTTNRGIAYAASTETIFYGDFIELVPKRYNTIMTLMGDLTHAAIADTVALTFRIYPRVALI